MTIHGWDSREKDGSLSLLSPNGDNIVEAKNIHETGGMGGPSVCELWVNGKNISKHLVNTERYVCFSPSASWSQNSKYLAVILWMDDFGNKNYSQFAVYDVGAETLRLIQNRTDKCAGYLISNFEYEIKKAMQDGAELHEIFGLSSERVPANYGNVSTSKVRSPSMKTMPVADSDASSNKVANNKTRESDTKVKATNIQWITWILLIVFIGIFIGRLYLFVTDL